MSDSTVVKELPETSMWHGAISEEDVALVRRRHAEKVEEWLDFADFVTELNALHEKYGIEKGEEGYFAYRKHLRTNYYQKLETYGPTPDPLDEGCECIFCKMHSEEPPVETESEVKKETVVHSTASGECELPVATSKLQGTHVPRSPVANQEPAEPDSKKLGPVPTTVRTLNVDHPVQEGHCELSPHSGPYTTKKNHRVAKSNTGSNHNNRRLGQVPAESLTTTDQSNNKKNRFLNLRPVPAYVACWAQSPIGIPSDGEILEQPGNWLRSG
ncbi:MAG: hypothetical protein NXI22_01240 [bacterium]|nr:hypothetical protein [bacterium]